MRNSNNRGQRSTKTLMRKCSDSNGIARTYSDIQLKYCEMLEEDDTVLSYKLNVPLANFSITDHSYTTDFLITLTTGDLVVGECVQRELIFKPMNVKLLDASREYWFERGIKPENWKLITNANKE